MKKLVLVTVLASFISFMPEGLPQANAAASLQDIQQLIQLKQEYEQGNKSAVMASIVQTVLARSGNSEIASIATGGSLSQAVQTYVKQGVQQKVNERLLPYQKEMDVLSTLLNLNNVLKPQAVKDNNSLAGAPENYSRIIDMTATAYGPGPLDNGKWGNLTYVGGTVQKGVVAVDPRVIPMGTKLWVEGYGYAIAEDQGSAIKGNRIDLAFDTRQEALDYGIKQVKVYVLK